MLNNLIKNSKKAEASFYNFSATTILGEEIAMEQFRGKTVLIVNTASKCGFTQQYEGLEKLYQKFKDRGFVILGFPCNQFANQEPDDESSILNGCVVNFGISFPMFSKIQVFGPNIHPLYVFLKQNIPGVFGGRILWNFTKFLIDSNGNPVRRFAPISTPEKIDKYLSEKIFR